MACFFQYNFTVDGAMLCQGGVTRSVVFVCHRVRHIVTRITHERVYGCQPNMVSIGKWLNFGVELNPDDVDSGSLQFLSPLQKIS